MTFSSKRQYDLFAARKRRDAGMDAASSRSPSFVDDVLAFVLTLPIGWIGTGEDIRRLSGLEPHHPNVWGATLNHIGRKGVISKTGRYVQPKDTKSNASVVKEYIRI
jgi:hypothetical protein